MVDTIPAFVISLPDAVSRRERISAMLEGVMPYSIIDATAGKDLEGQEHRYTRTRDGYCPRAFRYLSSNEIACALSHQKALRAFLECEAPYGLILEDDAEISPECFSLIGSSIDAFPNFDILKIGGHGAKLRPGKIVAASQGVRIVSVLMPSVCAHAYIVSRSGAAKLVASMLPIAEPFDAFLRNLYQHKCTIYETSPWLAGLSSQSGASTIGGDRSSQVICGSPAKIVRSALWRLRHNTLRHIHNLRRFGFSYISKSGFVRLDTS